MPWTDGQPDAEPPEDPAPEGDLTVPAVDLLQLVAAAADLCRRPLRHGVVVLNQGEELDLLLRLETRDPGGERLPEHDLELEIYRSGQELNLTLAWLVDGDRPMLWQGSHGLWMDGQGMRCQPPEGAAPLEALARRLRALLLPGS
jgi:hypothetical protein